jgi:5,5'-dehydrodivanillate O-demethylase
MCQVGAGTLMGELLRRYWHPVAAVADLEDEPIKAIRLLGEDLVLYQDRRGTYGLLGRHCPHRRADLSYGWVEEQGLRCSYHGWCFDETGRCLAQPFEDAVGASARFKETVRQRAYRVEAKAGLLFAYLGPEPAPLVPNWEPFTWQDGFVQVAFSTLACNWLQCQDNSIDPVHFEWLHDTWPERQRGSYEHVAPRHMRLAFDEFEFGFTYRRIREDIDETSELWTIGRTCLWPNALFTGDHFEWRVPIDDETTLSVGWFFDPVPKEVRPYHQERIFSWTSPVSDPTTGRFVTSHVMNQDFVAWLGQGTISERSEEHLSRSDRGVALMRRRLREEAEAVAAGRDPKGLVRDPEQNRCLELPIVGRRRLVEGPTLAEKREQIERARARYGGPFPFLAGQPPQVEKAYEAAMGL